MPLKSNSFHIVTRKPSIGPHRGTNFFHSFFLVFVIFDCTYAKIVEPPVDGNGHSRMPLKGQSLLKNGENGMVWYSRV